MKSTLKLTKSALSIILSLTIVLSMVMFADVAVGAAEGTAIQYAFSGDDKDTAGYAEGTITLSSDTDGTYYLYWADDEKALDGYYEIAELTIADGESASFTFGYHTAIPAGATQVIATTAKTVKTAADAVASYSIPESKLLSTGAGSLLYKFNSYSDVHIDANGYYVNALKNWEQALKFGVNKGTDFIVSSGDMVTNASGPDTEWIMYEDALAKSDYVNPVWESNGNHDMRTGVAEGLTSFVRASGTDSTIANYDANKPYYYVTEESTGDLFIFMALESASNPSSADEFSQEQMTWLTDLLSTYYGTGINIYIIEHSPIKGFGAGDRMSDPYYKAHLSESYISTVQFKSLLQKYPNLIWMSGHTHEDFTMNYNYSNENNTACHMIHNPSVAGSTLAAESASSLDYNNGVGYNSQGYYVEVYENEVIYYGANLTDECIYPAYTYIMEGSRGTTQEATNPTGELTTAEPAATEANTGSTLPEGIETNCFYFANTEKWNDVSCYSWSGTDTSTCKWPGYAATYYGTSEEGVDLYYCKVPASHTFIIWNNGGNGIQTVDIELDGVNNFYTPISTGATKLSVKASVWEYDPVTEPVSTPDETDPIETTAPETTAPIETTEPVTEPIETTEPVTTEPVSTEPAETTEPETTEPETTEPETTEPETTEPETTEPVTTEPESTGPSYDLGDVDLNGKINVNDATAVQKHLAELIVLTEQQLAVADTDLDGKISVKDATEIQKFVAEIITQFGNGGSEKSAPVDTGAESLVAELAKVKTMLTDYYTFSSYDQYQALKKLYYQYKDTASADNESEVIARFEDRISDLNIIAEHIGVVKYYPVGDVYYFENTNDWTTVNCYAYSGSTSNATWPGVIMEKVGTNNGHDVYGIKFKYAGQFNTLIFNNGTEQTVNIDLTKYEFNCFALSGTDSATGKLTVSNFAYTAEVEPTLPTTPVDESTHYAMCYYNSGAHGWSDIDTFLIPQGNGTFALDFVAQNSENVSLNIYDNQNEAYNCVPASTKLTFAADASETYELKSSASRGKSITVYELTPGSMLRLVYNPTTNMLSITCVGAAVTG